ncbi:MAG: tellurite resistance/C4-dicarboxylate transporter family protein [Burkholderiales bacterium]|nr:tellurite resistance/C4-dicarboxylate transporter family protein [Burkholderiales bacterium]
MTRRDGVLDRISEQVRGLYPGYFALVMATGIISNAAWHLGRPGLSHFLLAVNIVAFPALILALLLRTACFRRELLADVVNPRLVFSFFTIVAACDVFGLQLALRGNVELATAFWLVALALWTLLGYVSFSVLTFINTESGADLVHGGWLIAIVGTESLVLLGAQLAPHFGAAAPTAFVLIHALWGIGVVFYGIFITLFSYRLFFLRVEPRDVTPLFWVVMGAAAIGVNAGSALILTDPGMPFLLALRPFVDGTTLILWAWATWWIPMLVILGVWKYVLRKEPFAYHPMFWSLVFPLGMYTLATYRLSLAADFPPLRWIPHAMIWVALGAWTLTMLGAVATLWRVLRVPALDAERGTPPPRHL